METFDAVVVGAGMAGLAAAWQLRAAGARFVVLERDERPGDTWRRRPDSLRLFTPARFCELPGWSFPLDPRAHPDRAEMADYLSDYAARFALPVRTGVGVRAHTVVDGRHRLTTDDGAVIGTNAVIAATGAFDVPAVPAFATELDPSVRQMHSAGYRRPADLVPGPVLVVGAGTSGADIAMDLVGDHQVWMAGRSTGSVPVALARSPLVRQLVFGRRVPAGRLGQLVRERGRRAAPLVWQSPASLRAAGIRRVPRVVGVSDGRPRLADDRVLTVANVVWCTGFRPGYGWLAPGALGPDGWPVHRRGVSTSTPGLGFVGMPLQSTFASAFLSGMPDDAAWVVARLLQA
ncbi:flavin-containing monooxygenase [Paractinoplanes maris]|uniref:flavin-containing monooxygenase n=1 Tax=Paractinoplanes maris TaxID=1734446 RepID=UPI00202279AD|nr:FAD-dependent oxidoreductase [Actinoplanes maris]